MISRDFCWPVAFVGQADGSVLVRFPDLPEALTAGDGPDDAMAEALPMFAPVTDSIFFSLFLIGIVFLEYPEPFFQLINLNYSCLGS